MREEQLYRSRGSALAVFSSTTMLPVRGSGRPTPGKSSSSSSTATRSVWASASSGYLRGTARTSHGTCTQAGLRKGGLPSTIRSELRTTKRQLQKL